ncbi:thioredoxin domain-containing protein [Thiomicrorhabdus cannonii]|uniref:thioredoxin domain-containing protein n=1 Tax=Thiomicrorhabdus cannonii TaxID=2748011 RepID=UPI0015BA60CC|nr:DUF255 domain-containing protein [Thiomicrorhabdus cannonii]
MRAGLLSLAGLLWLAALPWIVWLLPSPSSYAADTSLTPQTTPLQNHPSQYLAMHAADPVHWLDWSKAVLHLAQQQQKPILISSGYFACHWCHVMQQENYQDQAAAELVNQAFIAVKLDRELHPDLDNYLLEFARQTTGRAGWPQHVVLTPQGLPFAAFGYLSNAAFKDRLTQLTRLWQTQRPLIQELAAQAINTRQAAIASSVNRSDFKTHLYAALHAHADTLSGGLSQGSSKFPQTPLLLALIQQTDLGDLDEWLQLTLEQMQNEHLQDHVHGGFFRYTVDPQWQIPHFEKMLYDNAQLARLYFLGAQRWHRADFLATAERTLTYLESHLFDPQNGLFQSSESALDAQGREGGAYLWSLPALKSALPTELFNAFNAHNRLQSTSPFELGWLPRPTQNHWDTIRQRLSKSPQAIPHDNKLIPGWNGLLLSSYVTAYSVTDKNHYLQSAERLSARLLTLFERQQVPRALDAQGQPIGWAQLDDFAYVLQGLHDLQQIAPEAPRRTAIARIKQRLQNDFRNEHGWQSNRDFLLLGQQRQLALADTATPSPTAILEVLQPSSNLLLPPDWHQNPLAYASYLQTPPP